MQTPAYRSSGAFICRVVVPTATASALGRQKADAPWHRLIITMRTHSLNLEYFWHSLQRL